MTVRPHRLLSTVLAAGISGVLLASNVHPALAQPGDEVGPVVPTQEPTEPGSEPFAVPNPDESASMPPPESLPESQTGLYLVQLAQPSLATYTGGVPGLPGTSPQATGEERLDPADPDSRAYLAHLASAQDRFEDRMAGALGRQVRVEHRYLNVWNGMAVAVEQAEAQRLAALPEVAGVYPDQVQQLTTDVSHEVIGTAGFWDGDTGPGIGTRGEGVVIGVLDGGINPDHPAFATVDGEGYVHENPRGPGNYVGVCDPGHPHHEDICNEKLIGAYNLHPDSPSARDVDDHGSHVASTAAGNLHQASVMVGEDTYSRTVQGVAPRANLISYLICAPGCPVASAVAAVNQAIEDGVDVLNYSVSGSDDPWTHPVERAFLDAYEAGIFIAASAGNEGPDPGSVGKTGPWNATVAGSTHHRVFGHLVDVLAPEPVPELTGLAGAASVDGPAVGADVEAELAYSTTNPDGCEPFSEQQFAGRVAVIDRGNCVFSVKVDNAAQAGAVAVLIANNAAGPPTILGDLAETAVPALMLERDAGAAIRELLADSAAPVRVRIHPETELFLDPEDWPDVMVGSSSRGPSRYDLLAPTFTAPGANILAAGREEPEGTPRYTQRNGTSMAAPHAAGAAALLVSLHPDWSPAQVRSALASTADPDALRMEDGTGPANPLAQGSGRLDLTAAARAGLVLDESAENFAAADPALGGDPRSLNLPGLVDGNCVPSCSWTRTVTGVADTTATYTVSVRAPEGMSVEVSPSQFTVAPGETVTLSVAVTPPPGRPAGDWRFADIWLETTGQHSTGTPIAPVHYPVVVGIRPPELTVEPEDISSSQTPDRVVTRDLTIGNAGGVPLSWGLSELSAEALGNNPAPAAANTDAAWRWDQPGNGAGGIVSDYYNGPGSGVYAADDFVVPMPITVDTVRVGGFWNTGDLNQATALNWYLYPDVAGAPAGHPQDGLGTEVWSYRTAPDAPGVSLSSGGARLDLAAAGVELELPRGSYWLTFFPEIDSDCCAAGNRWNWGQAASQGAPAHLIDPGNLFGSGTTSWTPLPSLGIGFAGTAFQLEGTIDCVGDDLPWLDAAPHSGLVEPGGQDTVEVTLDSTGLAPGVHSGGLCITSDDPDREVAVVPVTLEVEAPAPEIEVIPQEVSASLLAGTVAQQELTIGNTGEATLEWNLHFGGGQAAGPEPPVPAGPGTVLWEQPVSGTSGVVSDYFAALGGGIYAADEFVLAEPASVNAIQAEGFWNAGGLSEATALNWFIYPDAEGAPAGHPGDGQDRHVWSHRAPPTGAGVNVSDNNMALDLPAAGTALVLQPGVYWLVAFPEIDSPSTGASTRWNWRQAARQGHSAHLIDPTDLFGAGATEWIPFDAVGLAYTGVAFRLEGREGSIGCMAGDVPWLQASPSAGIIAPGDRGQLALTLDASSLPAGEHSASVCVSSNDPDHPVVEIPVTLSVVEPAPQPSCDQTIDQTWAGPLTVAEGTTCVAPGVLVDGPVTVETGAGLVAVRARVNGPVTATGPAWVEITDSRMSGPIMVSTASGPVWITGTETPATLSIVDGHAGEVAPVISGNRVGATLWCQNNQPPPTDLGIPNVAATADGQCAGLTVPIYP